MDSLDDIIEQYFQLHNQASLSLVVLSLIDCVQQFLHLIQKIMTLEQSSVVSLDINKKIKNFFPFRILNFRIMCTKLTNNSSVGPRAGPRAFWIFSCFLKEIQMKQI